MDTKPNHIRHTHRRKGQQRPANLRVRVTAYEAKLIHQRAAELQTTVSELIRHQLVEIGALPPEALRHPLSEPGLPANPGSNNPGRGVDH